LLADKTGHDDHSPPSSAEIPLLPLDDFVVWEENFTFTLPRNILFPLGVNVSTE
jgi:hypothetical protein